MIFTSRFSKTVVAVFVVALTVWVLPFGARADVQDEINAKNQQIRELERQIAEYQKQAEAAGAQSRTLEQAVARLNAQIGSLTAQIRSLEASIERTDLEIEQTLEGITDAERQVALHQEALAQSLRTTDEIDQKSLAHVLLQDGALSDFFDYLNSVERTQDTLRIAIRSLRDVRASLDDQRISLEDQRVDLERMQALQAVQQQQLASTRNEQNTLLKETKGEEDRYQNLVNQTQRDLQRLKEQLNYLLQGGITVEDAVSYAKLAALGAGIRPAFLLALLEIESRLGENVGTGNWRDDMYECYIRLADYYPSRRDYYLKRAETEKNAFFAVIGKLGLDPDTVKVSREPTYGCGGAMGPAQFIPSTWLGYEEAVIGITGNNPPNPWNFQDAFTAAAVKLARGGATSQDVTGETRAAKAYISGNPTCSSTTCNNYANAILKKAADIERDL